jgi:hypothetical protein
MTPHDDKSSTAAGADDAVDYLGGDFGRHDRDHRPMLSASL